jgi:8-oxo-dGTP pyrophosphatase MutT (NUDIX family)
MATRPKNEAPGLIVAVGAVAYQHEPAGALLILLIKKRGGYWTLPKGKLLPGETHNSAVVREVEEETGLRVEVEAELEVISYCILKQRRRLPKQVTYYLAHATGGELRPGAHEQILHVRWFDAKEALRRLKRERLRRVVRASVMLIGRSDPGL